MGSPQLRTFNHKQPTRLDNDLCAYCGAEFLREDEPQKEHVIGKRFVPLGYFQQQWNLHLNSCFKCNQCKSNLEEDIAAITLIQSLNTANRDREVVFEAEFQRRASKTKSKMTGRPISESAATTNVSGSFGGAKVSFGFIAPPQIENSRAFELAGFQIAGLFYFLTYNDKLKTGYRWPGCFRPIGFTSKPDWGNESISSFASAVEHWDYRIGFATAKAHFVGLVKKCPDFGVWSWAFEWNKNYRIYGFCGIEEPIEAIANGLSSLNFDHVNENDDGSIYRMRREVPACSGETDLFFYYDDLDE